MLRSPGTAKEIEYKQKRVNGGAEPAQKGGKANCKLVLFWFCSFGFGVLVSLLLLLLTVKGPALLHSGSVSSLSLCLCGACPMPLVWC